MISILPDLKAVIEFKAYRQAFQKNTGNQRRIQGGQYGSFKMNLVPFPRIDSTSISPLWSSTIMK